MENRKRNYYLRTTVSAQEKEQFQEIAGDVEVPYYLLMRHLARYILNNETKWVDLLNKLNKSNTPGK